MKYQERCGHCHNVTTAFTHNINKPLVSALGQLIRKYYEIKVPVNINSGLDLTHNQIANMPKLQYFGLIRRTSSGWVPTEIGIKWYNGEERVLVPVATMNNEVIPDNHKAWQTHKKGRKSVTIYDIVGYNYKQREEYQQEKSPQQDLDLGQ